VKTGITADIQFSCGLKYHFSDLETANFLFMIFYYNESQKKFLKSVSRVVGNLTDYTVLRWFSLKMLWRHFSAPE
jgi:hypothetical protein